MVPKINTKLINPYPFNILSRETLPRHNLSPRRNHHPSGLRYDSSTTIGGPSHSPAILRLHATSLSFRSSTRRDRQGRR
ncbi:unnamed protein product [Linum tenue]|uniref:Uncharacterized protein n=1 Tax=Linum tenue TaxID=586396 RepID=A0AAV0JT22_9ROSI|nr:unnamed protein product [Linum tenue]